jgi:YHS domain-containing protein
MKIIIAIALGGISFMGCKTTKPIDPVCAMRMNGNFKWTDYSVFKSDTVWFCNPKCKLLFDANPMRYEKKFNWDKSRNKVR